jgi:hypothetical protein
VAWQLWHHMVEGRGRGQHHRQGQGSAVDWCAAAVAGGGGCQREYNSSPKISAAARNVEGLQTTAATPAYSSSVAPKQQHVPSHAHVDKAPKTNLCARYQTSNKAS